MHHAAFCLLSTSRSGKYTWKPLSLARFLAFQDVVELEMSSDAILRRAERLGHHMRRRGSRSIYVMDNPSTGSMTVEGVEAVERGPASTWPLSEIDLYEQSKERFIIASELSLLFLVLTRRCFQDLAERQTTLQKAIRKATVD